MTIDLYDLRRREVQAIGAAISTRNWHALETAYNSLRDKLDQAGFHVSGTASSIPAQPASAAGEVEPGQLLPCPFCGGDAERLTIQEPGDNFGGDVIQCMGVCGASSHVEFGRKENLESLWNSRVAPQQPDTAPAVSAEVAIWSGEHRAYWRRGSDGSGSGYTGNVLDAGVWPRADAIRMTSHCGPEKLIALHDRPSTSPSTREDG